MKVLVFTIGPDRYALPLAALSRVLPVAQLKQIALAPPFVAGLLDLHGEPVPVIDLSTLAGFVREDVWFDTRIIVAEYPVAGRGVQLLGLMAEHVIGIETVDPQALRASGVVSAPFLGQIASDGEAMLQLVEVTRLLPPAVSALLFPAEVAP